MGKLVLGIIAVTLLQMAFFVYTWIDWPPYATVDVVRVETYPDEKSPELRRVDEPPDAVVSENVLGSHGAVRSAVPVSNRTKAKTFEPTGLSPASARPRPILGRRNQNPRRDRGEHASSDTGSGTSPTELISIGKPTGSVLPRGYTMVLVDYPAQASHRKTAEDISKTRKRPYLARALPALIKKPWKWMKSLASKLD